MTVAIPRPNGCAPSCTPFQHSLMRPDEARIQRPRSLHSRTSAMDTERHSIRDCACLDNTKRALSIWLCLSRNVNRLGMR